MLPISPCRLNNVYETNFIQHKPKNLKELLHCKNLMKKVISASMDIGSSDKIRGTVKKTMFKQNNILLHDSGKLCPDGIEDSQDFVEHIIANFSKGVDAVKKTGNKIKELIIFTTGRPRMQKNGAYKIERFSTLFQKDGQMLKNIDYSPINKKYPGFKVSIFNDMLGAICAVLQKTKPQEIPDSGLVITTGGGFGTGYFEKIKTKRHNYFKLSESRDGRRTINGKTMEEYGNSVRAYIRNFCTELGMNEEKITHYINEGDGRFVTWENPEFLKKNSIDTDLMKSASKASIDKYAEGIAHCVKLKVVDDGGNLQQVFLSGKLVDGINRFITNHSEIWGKKELNLENLIKSKLQNDAGVQNFDKIKDFKVTIVKDIADNTEGATFLFDKKYKIKNEKERGQEIVSLYVPYKP